MKLTAQEKKSVLLLSLALAAQSCASSDTFVKDRLIPAEEFSRSLKAGEATDYSIFKAAKKMDEQAAPASAQLAGNQEARAALAATQPLGLRPLSVQQTAQLAPSVQARNAGLDLKRSIQAPQTEFINDGGTAQVEAPLAPTQFPRPPQVPTLPPGSQSPYLQGQMTANPSLWPDEGQGANLFTDFRAFQAMDVITILVNESSVGSKKTKTDTEGKFNILAGISSLFGVETKSWVSNNEALKPESLIQAKTETKYEGEGETKREGAFKAQLSAVIMEVLPNGLMRIEGSKIVSVDSEEEVMVISGLVRNRDIDSLNRVESNRVANMRIDFYGRGVLAEQQAPGWGARLFKLVWPF